MYNTNWYNQITTWLPYVLRRNKMTQWLSSLVQGVVTLYNYFVSYRINVRRNIISTGQVCYLEQFLNDEFNKNSIYITDGVRSQVYIGRNSDPDPLMIATAAETHTDPMIGKNADYQLEYDFIVNVVDEASEPSELAVRSVVDKFKLAGKNYNVVYYSPT